MDIAGFEYRSLLLMPSIDHRLASDYWLIWGIDIKAIDTSNNGSEKTQALR